MTNPSSALANSTPDVVWVVGAGGLVGRAIRARAAHRAFIGQTYTWSDVAALRRQFATDAAAFAQYADRCATSWGIVWAAGRGVVGTPEGELHHEGLALSSLIDAVARHRPSMPGALFFSSSAGAVYAGSVGRPFSELTAPAAISAYGEHKLTQEELVRRGQRSGAYDAAVIGRIANVYGPGQNVRKPQGLITHLCLTAATRRPLNLFVPLDTRRHYVESRDVAVQVDSLLGAALTRGLGTCTTKVMTSASPVTVGEVLQTVRRVARRPVRVASGIDARAPLQAADLTLKSVVWPEIGIGQGVTLPIGIHTVMREIDAQVARGIAST